MQKQKPLIDNCFVKWISKLFNYNHFSCASFFEQQQSLQSFLSQLHEQQQD